jgi:hypothetical protein
VQKDRVAYATSTKRHVLYPYDRKGNVVIVDAKVHRLGISTPPQDKVEHEPESD